MNREIKFRGRSEYGAFVYGDLIQYENGDAAIFEKKLTKYGCEATEICKRTKVNAKTVSQFTGLYDKNRREIYEGDIVTWLTGRDGKGFLEIGRVEWRQAEGCYVVINRFATRDNREIVQPLIRCTRDLKVVGNIHDNPGLLEGGRP